MKQAPFSFRRLAFWLALGNGVIAAVLGVASLLHLPVTKFPTEWELQSMQQMVRQRAQLSPEEAHRFERSVGRVHANDRNMLTVLLSLRRVAIYGFTALAVLSFALAYLLRTASRRVADAAPHAPAAVDSRHE
jgi:multisubunit Na+/H+ antiporter MnhB subunit